MSFTEFCTEVWYNWLNTVTNNYARFNGRASCREYWEFVLFNFAVGVVLAILSRITGVFTVIDSLYSLAVLVPSLAIAWRRLHDTNKSGLYYLLVLIPLIGWIIVLVRMIRAGDRGTNPYGMDPLSNY